MEHRPNEEEHITRLFREVSIPQIPEQEIEKVTMVAADYLSVGRKKVNLWDIALLELGNTSILLWIACAALMAGCVFFISTSKSSLSAAGIFVAMAPTPLFLSLIELMTTRTPAVVELEKACKYNVNQLYVVKVMIGTVLNIVILALLATFTAHSLNGPLNMFLMGSCTMLLTGFLALLIATKFGQSLPLMGVLGGWIVATSILFGSSQELSMALLNMEFKSLLAILVLSIALFAYGVRVFSRELTTLSLGGIS